MEREEFRARVKEIAGPEGWFQTLNPYAGNDPVFNIEDVNYSLTDKKVLEPLYLFAVSAKRYALANRGVDGEWIIRKASGHGLGHVTAPRYDKNALPPHPAAPINPKDGKPTEGKICRGSNPKLLCDLWRIAFGAARKALT